METTQTTPTPTKALKAIKEEAPKKEKVTAESVALNGPKDNYIKSVRNATLDFEKLVEAEFEKVDVGHPHYGALKFAKIRIDRIRFAMDELSKGKASR